MAEIGKEWSICHSNIAAAKLAMNSFPTNSTTPDRLASKERAQTRGNTSKLAGVKGPRPNRRSDENTFDGGRRCPLPPTDPPGSIAAKFNDRVTKGVDPTVTFLGK